MCLTMPCGGGVAVETDPKKPPAACLAQVTEPCGGGVTTYIVRQTQEL